MLVATDAASEGLNLHKRCRLVVNLELPWTPLRLEQRVGRVDRIGQSRPVHALHLVAAGTGEESIVARLSERAARARASLEQIGEAVIRGIPPVEAADAVGSNPKPQGTHVVTIDLRREAEAEAQRLQTARALMEDAGSLSPSPRSSRPAICVLRRRARQQASLLWTWRLTFTDDRGRLLWESLLPLRACAARGEDTAASARACAGSDDPRLVALLQQAQNARLADLAAQVQAGVALLARREHAIVASLEKRHARLAAALLQPGLFDRRAERAAIAQASLVAEVRSRAAARLIELEASGRPVVEERRLVFAVALQ